MSSAPRGEVVFSQTWEPPTQVLPYFSQVDIIVSGAPLQIEVSGPWGEPVASWHLGLNALGGGRRGVRQHHLTTHLTVIKQAGLSHFNKTTWRSWFYARPTFWSIVVALGQGWVKA